MATPTLANFPNSYSVPRKTLRQALASHCSKSQATFRVFPTSSAEYHWQIVLLATNQTISRHKSLSLALTKCTGLNNVRSKGAKNESK